MNPGSDAAEQVVRMSLEGVEVAARVTGVGAKHTALLIAAVLKENQKTRGKARLTSMLKSGKELKVYTISEKDIQSFATQAKKYGVLYCVLRNKSKDIPNKEVDVMVKAEDASKVSRILEKITLVSEAATVNPTMGRSERSPLSLPKSEVNQERASEKFEIDGERAKRPSVLAKLEVLRKERDARLQEKRAERDAQNMWGKAIAGLPGVSQRGNKSKKETER